MNNAREEMRTMVDQRAWKNFYLRAGATLAATMVCVALGVSVLSAQEAGQKTFSSAAEASKALVAALHAEDRSALLEILGPGAKDIVSSSDAAEDKVNHQQFVEKYKKMHRLVMEPNGSTTLYIGAENWPTPIPLKKKGEAWYFDTAAGKKEILYRRVGRNELSAIQVCRELVDAEKEYFGQPHDGDSGSQYAQKFSSDSGKHNGLYWEASAGENKSPIGPMLAAAFDGGDQKAEPFMGYYFRILTGQKTRSYIVDGKMTRGFAFVGYPAQYRVSGVMTFIVDQDGVVYEKDLGPQTAELAKKLTQYDHNASWRKAD
jgi:hypothetical protein